MPTTLPSPPRSLAAVLDAAGNPDVSLENLAKVVQGDPSFASMALRVVNTARYQGNRGSITNIRLATMRLGVRTLRNLAVCHAAQSVVSAKQLKGFNLQLFWERSLQRAVAAELIADRLKGADPSEAFTGGLLMDLGVLALVLEDTSRVDALERMAELERPERLAAETAAFGRSRADVAGSLAREWKLPDELGIPMAMAACAERAPGPLRGRCHILAASDALAQVLAVTDTREALHAARRALVRELDWPEERAEELLEALGASVRESAQTLGFHVGPQPSLDDLLQAANRSLVDINLSYEELVRRLEQTIAEKAALAEELDRRNQELERISRTDSLTGLPNRCVVFTEAERAVGRADRYGEPVSMVVCDIDHFKRFNDTHGHVFGDEVLRAVAGRLQDSVRTVDVVARTGGEEFAFLLPSTDLAGARIVAERARRAVASLNLLGPDGRPAPVTVSLGVASLEAAPPGRYDYATMVNRMYQIADDALYEAKGNGRNRVVAMPSPVSWAELNLAAG
jgi:diguanylate cyclase (GGDEF)-like protein